MAEGTRTPVLETRGLVVSFGGVVAVDGVDLRLYSGEVRAVIGPNGAGKTTLFNAITGTVRPTRGRVFLFGEDITGLPPHQVARRGVARTFQITSLFPELTVWENIWLSANSRGPFPWHPLVPAERRDAIYQEVERVTCLLGLEGLLDRPAGTLSHGDQRLLEIAVALGLGPRILFLDEPTQGVSPREVERIQDIILEIAQDRTVLMVEHNMATVMRLAHQVTVLDRGRVIAEGPPHEVVKDRRVQQAYLGVV